MVVVAPKLRIDYQSVGFDVASNVANGFQTLTTSWDDLLWSAITVGRPNRAFVFQHGEASIYEALFRFSLVRMSLEQSSVNAYRLRRTQAAKTLDPSEKGAINYFLGLTFAKLFASQVLNAPWLLHLDVFRPQLNPVLSGRSRPDLVGQTAAGQWIALECKGRASEPNADAKAKAKAQAVRLTSVNGSTPLIHAAAFTFFRGDVVQFFWEDPPAKRGESIAVDVDADAWLFYYAPALALVRSDPATFLRMLRAEAMYRVDAADLEIGIRPEVLRALVDGRWNEARHLAESLSPHELYRRDGIAVIAGPSWRKPFQEEGAEPRGK